MHVYTVETSDLAYESATLFGVAESFKQALEMAMEAGAEAWDTEEFYALITKTIVGERVIYGDDKTSTVLTLDEARDMLAAFTVDTNPDGE